MTISLPQQHEPTGSDGRFGEVWYRALLQMANRLSGRAPPQVPVVHVGGSVVQRGLPNPVPDGQLVLVADESGGPVLAFSYGNAWLRSSDGAVVS